MSSLSRIAKQVVQTAKSLKVVRLSTQAKWDALLASRPSYTLFDNPPNHPYTALVQSAEQLENHFDKIIAALHPHPINGTKLYWLLSRCLLDEPERRTILLI